MLDVPVAFVIFNRPELTRVSFESIRSARPQRLFLISDGPRRDREGEAERVREARRIAEDVSWDCDVVRIYADENLGCGRRISSGISAALRHVDRLIVLEDDCVAHASFFGYCRELLRVYEPDSRVMAISGDNFQPAERRYEASYWFSKFPHCWGWATWRRAWQHFDLAMERWPSWRDSGGLERCCDCPRETAYWSKLFDRVRAGRIDTWDYPWLFACWSAGGLTALPRVNLVSNIGFGPDATHTDKSSPLAALPTADLGPIVHPSEVVRDAVADRWSDDYLFSGAEKRRWLRWPKRQTWPSWFASRQQRRRAA